MEENNYIPEEYTLEETEMMAKLYPWVFHYNVYTGNWAAIPRELIVPYFNDIKTPGILFSRELDTLADLIYRTNGEQDSIDELLKNQ